MSDAEELVPVLHTADAHAAAAWYGRMGFEIVGDHQFADGLPHYLFLAREGVHLHLSEHAGDARPDTLVYFYVTDVEAIAAEYGADVRHQPWAREIELTDPDGNRLRIGTIHDTELG